MAEMYGICTDLLFEELKRRINAGIVVDISGDVLTVRLVNDAIAWECSVADISKLIALGCSMSRIAEKITKEYRKEILRRYFY